MRISEVPLERCDKIASGSELVTMQKWNLGGGSPFGGGRSLIYAVR